MNLDQILASWQDPTMDTGRDAQRMQQVVAYARLLERRLNWLTARSDMVDLGLIEYVDAQIKEAFKPLEPSLK